MSPQEKEFLMSEALELMEKYDLSYGQISRYFDKFYGVFIHRQTIYRWLN